MLTFEDWLRLPNDKERGERYKELSDSDRFKVRMGDYYFGNKPGLIGPIDKKIEFDIPDFLKDLEVKENEKNTRD